MDRKSSQALGFGCPAQYKSTNQDYGQQNKVDDKEVPTYSEIVQSMTDFKRAEKLLKNKSVASQYSKEVNLENMDEIQKEKYKFDRNVILPKQYPYKAEQFKYPEPGLNVGNPLYKTSNMDYGSKLPTDKEIPNKFYPRDCSYTLQFPGNFKFNGLNTAKTYSKVHNHLDEHF